MGVPDDASEQNIGTSFDGGGDSTSGVVRLPIPALSSMTCCLHDLRLPSVLVQIDHRFETAHWQLVVKCLGGVCCYRLKEKFPVEGWHLHAPTLFREAWLGYTRAWMSVLAEWDADEFSASQPRGDAAFPLHGLESITDWGTRRGEARQRELIGMTAE
eukprot:SAG31_NODE_22508_length_524_cov_0.842353_1_plen_157_part_01